MAAQDHLGLHLADAVKLFLEHDLVYFVQPRRVDRRPQDLPVAQVVVGEFGGVLGYVREERSETVGAEERARLLVVETGGGGVVERRR